MTQCYFLGANSGSGFVSLYDQFPPDPGVMLHIIKSGPGTGKSGFMRRIGREAEGRGLDVQYVLCSGDPDSLDGVYIPALSQAWVDGTAPHVLEPNCYGADADYLHLGRFFAEPLSEQDKDYVNHLSRSYKLAYRDAYSCLASAVSLQRDSSDVPIPMEFSSKIHDLTASLPARAPGSSVPARRRFLHAISCQGELWLKEEVSKLCKHIYALPALFAAGLLQQAGRQAQERNLFAVCCSSPLIPEQPEALLLPEASIAFVSDSWGFGSPLLPSVPQLSDEQRRRRAQLDQLHTRLLQLALDDLRRAKALHDELEEVYQAHMDFAALTDFTEETLRRLFG